MPPGSKKRKAAKKKKELESQSQNHDQQPHSSVSQIDGNGDDLKRQDHDGKESEGKDVGSPSSHDLANHQHQFTDDEKAEVGSTDGSKHVESLNLENKFTEETESNGVAVKETVLDDSVASEELPKTVAEINISNGNEEHVGSEKDPGDGVLSETLIKESVVQIESESQPFEQLDKDAAIQYIEQEEESREGGLPHGDNDEYYVIDKVNVVVDNSPFASSTEATNLLAEGLTQVPYLVPVGEIYASVVESGVDTVSEPVHEKISIDSVCSEDSFAAVKHGIDEKWKNEADSSDQKDTSFLILEDSGLENKNDESVVATNGALGVSDAKNSTTQETEEMFLPDVTRGDEATNLDNGNNDPDCVKHLGVHEASDNQPLLGSAAQPVQRTSWMSCCGLLDVFSGSNR